MCFGAPGGTRTHKTRILSPIRMPIPSPGPGALPEIRTQTVTALDRVRLPIAPGEPVYGAGERNRTPDILITNQALYRLSYSSKILATVQGVEPRLTVLETAVLP